ncbi:hypothetical protein MNBD_CHLOROFLEXI01-1054 [hydrothermal vent metagenome]|uniref:DUF2335 domain-containing protein n=1 Tax=hydrothermal vent metagenome TaxID=652676 RepID=A0A3B0VKW1_9ZZZZ
MDKSESEDPTDPLESEKVSNNNSEIKHSKGELDNEPSEHFPVPVEDIKHSSAVEMSPEQKVGLMMVQQMEEYSGPLPHPKILKQYNEIVPGSAKEIILQSTKQSEHRQYLERHVIEGDVKRANWGLVAGFAVALITLGGSFYVITLGYGVEGIAAIIIALSALVATLIYADRRRKQEREKKQQLVPEKLQD